MKHRIKRTAIVCALILTLVMSCVCTSFAATGTKSSTHYYAFKKGNYVYCCARKGVYRVNVKTGSKKCIYKEPYPEIGYPGPLKYYKGYVYFLDAGAMMSQLYRVKANGKSKKRLANVIEYSINKGTIYYTTYNSNFDKTLKKKMSLNGKNKRKSSYKVGYHTKKTNKKGYYVKQKKKVLSSYYDYDLGGYMKTERTNYYLVTPGKKIKLCSYTDEYLDY